LRHQQGLHPVLETHPVLNQVLALPMLPLGVLFVRGRHSHDRANLSVTPPVAHQDPQQALGIQPVGLRASRTAAHEDAGWLDDMVADVMSSEQPMQPKAVTPGLKAAYEFNGRITSGVRRQGS